jgi:hypothetical protein
MASTQKITATGQTILGTVGEGRSGEMIVQISGGGTCSSVPKAYLRGGSVASPGTNCAYTPVKTGVLTDGATTAITTAGLYKIAVPAGCVLLLDNTFTSGTVIVDYLPSALA